MCGYSSEPWITAVNAVIHNICHASYMAANFLPNGQKRKKHVPYHTGQVVDDLVDCLGKNDQERAFAILMYNYECQGISRTCYCGAPTPPKDHGDVLL